MKICITCNIEKDDSQFAFKDKKTGLKASKCRECHKLYVKTHYESNKSSYLFRARRDRAKDIAKTKALIASLKFECARCYENHPAVLDFHHLDPSQKDGNISQMTSRKKIVEEAKKCIILCSNCHRKLHYEVGSHGEI